MHNDFIDMMSVFTNSELTGFVEKNQDFEEAIKNIESIFNPRALEKYKLDPTKFCPIVSSGNKPKYVIWGLNPHDDGERGELTGYTWEELADYHIPYNLYEDRHVFDRVLDPVVPYYRTIGSIIHGLESRRFLSWSEIRNRKNHEEIKREYLQMIGQSPMAVIEMIPFASKEILNITNNDLHRLLIIENRMNVYFQKLMNYILTKVHEEAWIICNGKNACETFLMMLDTQNKKLEKIIDYKDEKKYSLYLLDGKRVLLCHEFLRRTNGQLNSNAQLSALVYTVLTALGIEATDKYNGTY